MKKNITCQWRKLAFVNYIVPPEIVKKLIPPHTELDLYNGHCYISLVGFQFKDVAISDVPLPNYQNFEEINLRFYVKRFDGFRWRKGTVFISEIADKPLLAFLANTFLKEHYTILPTSQNIHKTTTALDARYCWTHKSKKQFIEVKSSGEAGAYPANSETAFLLERPYAYRTKDAHSAREYSVEHDSWPVYPVVEYTVDVDFAMQFGSEFSILSSAVPQSVILAEGSPVAVKAIELIGIRP